MIKINTATINLIKEFEGLRLTAYKCSADVWTIGYGTTGRAGVGIDPVAGMTITEAEADYYLEKAMADFAAKIEKCITAPISGNEFGAFVSLAYNIGPNGFKKSSALRHFNAGNKASAAVSIELWNKAGGKVLAGLVRRRKAEVALFQSLEAEPVDEPVAEPSNGLLQVIIGIIIKLLSGGKK